MKSRLTGQTVKSAIHNVLCNKGCQQKFDLVGDWVKIEMLRIDNIGEVEHRFLVCPNCKQIYHIGWIDERAKRLIERVTYLQSLPYNKARQETINKLVSAQKKISIQIYAAYEKNKDE